MFAFAFCGLLYLGVCLEYLAFAFRLLRCLFYGLLGLWLGWLFRFVSGCVYFAVIWLLVCCALCCLWLLVALVLACVLCSVGRLDLCVWIVVLL